MRQQVLILIIYLIKIQILLSGKIKILDNEAGIWKETKQYLLQENKLHQRKTQTINYNIPVMDIEKIADAFSLNDIQRRAGVLEMFKSQVPGSEAVKTKHAEGSITTNIRSY